MPFQPLTVGLSFLFHGLEAFSESYPFHGCAVNGDGLFVETRRQDGGVMLLLIDVQGHGDLAAQVVTFLRDRLLPEPVCENLRPEALLTTLNELLLDVIAMGVTGGRFAATVALLLDRSGTLTASNAGQPLPWIGVPGSLWQSWPLPPGTLLGILSPGGYSEVSTSLTTGQQLLAFSDGIAEAGAKQGNQFQHGPWQAFVNGLPFGTRPQDVVERLLLAARGHVGAGWPDDDTTVLCLSRH